jgi:uncharacterized protein YbjT (DUF2867 family)
MPVIVVGADTPTGTTVIEALRSRQGEVRAFVSDPDVGLAMRRAGVKVALGDVSDPSHVEAAALNAFSIVLVGEAADDSRERSFATSPAEVLAGWAEAARLAGVRRVIWVVTAEEVGTLPSAGAESAVVVTDGRAALEVAAEVAALDDAAVL